MSALLSVTDAHVAYGKVEAVRSVSLEVGQNQIVTIVGANGAGKTTLLSAIMGILPLKGRVAFAGRDLALLEIEDRVAMGLGLVPEHRELFVTMNVEDNLEHAKRASNGDRITPRGDGTFHLAAHIPAVIALKWLDDGIDVFSSDPEQQRKVKQRLNDPEWRYLRTDGGRRL